MTAFLTGLSTTASLDSFRTMMGGFPTGVAVGTSTDTDGMPYGMTCSSVCSVTLEPPTLLVCLRTGSSTLQAVRRSGRFAVNLLHGRAQSVAELFASGAPDRFDLVGSDNDPPMVDPTLPTMPTG